MASNVSRGAYYKARTRKWLAAHGWQVAEMEIVRWVYRPGGRPIPVKRDQFGSDLLAMNAQRMVLVQVKGGQAAVGGTFPAARREFKKFIIPPSVECWIVAWAPRAHVPRIVNVEGFTIVNLSERIKAHVQEEENVEGAAARGQREARQVKGQGQRRRLAQSQAQGI